MAGRVASTEQALRAAQQIESLLAGGMEQRMQAVAESLRTLSNPRVWDGSQAVEFRSTQVPRHQASLVRSIQSLRHLGSHAQHVTRSILDAGSQGASTGGSPALLVRPGPGGSVPPPDQLPPPGTDPVDVNYWWNSLSAAQQAQYLSQDPAQIGSLDGIPAVTRDEANRVVLGQQQSALQQQLYELQQEQRASYGDGYPQPTRYDHEIANIRDELGSIQDIQNQLDREPRAPNPSGSYLLGFDTQGGNVHYVVAVNNPDTAQNIATVVPGVDSPPHETNTAWNLNGVDNLAGRTNPVSSRPGPLPTPTTSTIIWKGYTSPDSFVGAANNHQTAADAAPHLDQFLTGLEASNQGSPHMTVIGHSYGSVVVGHAAPLPVQDVVLIGSPGVDTGANNADAFGLPGHVWAGQDPRDVIGVGNGTAGFGVEPTQRPFTGVNVFDAVDNNAWQDPVGAHGSYFNETSPALSNMADIVTGQYGAVTPNSSSGDFTGGT